MADAQGFKTKCGLGKESTYGTAVALVEVLPFKSEDVKRNVATLVNEYIDATLDEKNFDNSVVTVSGPITLEMVYDEIATDIIGIESVIYGLLGSATYVNPTFGNEYTTADDLDLHWTVAWEKNVSVWESISLKFVSAEITGSAGGKIEMTVQTLGKNLLRTGDSGIVNASSAFTALAPANDPELVKFDNLIFRVDDHGAALTDADQLSISEFTLSINNNLTDAQHATPGASAAATESLFTLEPQRNGRREITLQVTFPRYTDDGFFGDLNNGTLKQIDLKFTASNGKYINIYLPKCVVVDAGAAIPGPETFPLTVTFKALANGTTNTDMAFSSTTAITSAIGIECKSARTAIP